MTDMAELKKRKEPLNPAIMGVETDAFITNFMAWLEITAFLSAQRGGQAAIPAEGITPALSPEQLQMLVKFLKAELPISEIALTRGMLA